MESFNLNEQHSFFTTSDGVRLHYIHLGQGEPLILLHGWGGNAFTYYYNIEELSQHYSLYIVEMRGHGESEKPNYGYRLSRLAMDVREFFNSLNFEKANWMAHSMGVSVLWMYIDLFGQDTINKLILIDEAPFIFGNPEDTEHEIKQYGGVRLDLWQLCNALDKSFEEGIHAFSRYFNNSFYAQFDNPDVAEISAKQFVGEEAHKFLAKLLMDHITQDWRDVITRIKVPTMLISGEVSHASTRESSQWIAHNIKNCHWVEFSKEEYGTHFMMLNSAKKFNAEVLNFL